MLLTLSRRWWTGSGSRIEQLGQLERHGGWRAQRCSEEEYDDDCQAQMSRIICGMTESEEPGGKMLRRVFGFVNNSAGM